MKFFVTLVLQTRKADNAQETVAKLLKFDKNRTIMCSSNSKSLLPQK